MSYARKCDRCGMFYVDLTYEVTVKDMGRLGSMPTVMDLCEDCYKEFTKFMKNKEKKEKRL